MASATSRCGGTLSQFPEDWDVAAVKPPNASHHGKNEKTKLQRRPWTRPTEPFFTTAKLPWLYRCRGPAVAGRVDALASPSLRTSPVTVRTRPSQHVSLLRCVSPRRSRRASDRTCEATAWLHQSIGRLHGRYIPFFRELGQRTAATCQLRGGTPRASGSNRRHRHEQHHAITADVRASFSRTMLTALGPSLEV